ncbi:MAG: hypothetical protein ACPLXM_09305, partial [Bacteroidales bacterium]
MNPAFSYLYTKPGKHILLTENFNFYMRGRIYQHDTLNFNKIICSHEFQLPKHDSAFSITTGQNRFQIHFAMEKDPNFSDQWNATLTFTVKEGIAENISAQCIIGLTNWSKENYVFLPGAVYNGNRFKSRRIEYSPKLLEPGDIGPEIEPIITDVPRL